MSYFRDFPKIPYRFGLSTQEDQFTNLSIYVDILSQITDDSAVYNFYDVKDGERPDVVATKLYGTPELYWSFFLLNPNIMRRGWPLSYQELLAKLAEDYPGVCMVFFGQATNADTGQIQHELVGRYPIGTVVTGLLSGATGVVYDKNPMLGQLYVRVTSGTFVINEAIRPQNIDGYALVARIIHDPAYQAIRYVLDGNGNAVDVDYSSDFRGRPDEGTTDVQGGVIGDPDNPDIYANTSPYNIVTHQEHYEAINDDLSKLKVLKPSVAGQIPALYRKAIA